MNEEDDTGGPKWSLVRIILVPFGLSLKFKILDQFLSGLMVSTLHLLLLFISFSIPRSFEINYGGFIQCTITQSMKAKIK